MAAAEWLAGKKLALGGRLNNRKGVSRGGYSEAVVKVDKEGGIG